MAFESPDFAKESSTTTGTGNVTLLGARSPGQTFAVAGLGVGDTFHYAISHQTSNEWEVGLGTMLTATTFSRSPTASSNGGALVNFSAGIKSVDVVLPSVRIAQLLGPLQVGATTLGRGTLSLSNANGVSWGLATDSNGGTITASVSPAFGTVTLVNGFSAGNPRVTDGTNSSMLGSVLAYPLLPTSQNTSFSFNNLSYRMSGNTMMGIAHLYFSASNSNQFAQGVSFGNNVGISFGLSTTTVNGFGVVPIVTASVDAFRTVNLAFPAGTNGISGFTDSTFAGANIRFQQMNTTDDDRYSYMNVQFRASNNTLAAMATQLYLAGTTFAKAQNLSFQDLNGISFGFNALTNTFAGFGVIPGITASVEPRLGLISANAVSSVANATRLVFSNSNGITFGISTAAGAATVTASVGAGGAAGSISAGSTSVALGQAVFSNSNNVSFGLNGSTVTASVNAAAALTVSGNVSASVSLLMFSNLAGQNATFGLSTDGAGGATLTQSIYAMKFVNLTDFGGSTASLTSFTITSFGNQTMRVPQLATSLSTAFSAANVAFAFTGATMLAAAHQSYIDGASTVPAQAISFSNANGLSFSVATSNVANVGRIVQLVGSVAAQTSLSFSNANGVTFGIAGSTLTASVSPGGGGGMAISAAGNSVSNSTVVFSNSNGMSFGMAGSTVTAAAPKIIGNVSHVGGTSVSDVSQLAFSNAFNVNWLVSSAAGGATVQASATHVTLSGYTPISGGIVVDNAYGQNSLMFHPVWFPDVQFDRFAIPLRVGTNPASVSNVATFSITFRLGLYTRNASSLSLMHSISGTQTFAISSSNNSSLYSGLRYVTTPWTTTVSEGQYWYGFVSSTTASSQSTNIRNGMFSQSVADFAGYMGSANQSLQLQLGNGYFSVTTGALPSSVAFSQLQIANTASTQTNLSAALRPPALYFQSGTA